jgi:hypothetical protein
VRPGRAVGVLAVDELDDVNRRGPGVAEVVGGVGVADRRAGVVGVLGGDGAEVGLLAGQGEVEKRVDPGLGQVELVMVPSWSSVTTTLPSGTLPVLVTT